MPFRNFPEQLAVGLLAHLLRIGEIRRRDRKFLGALAFSIALFSVAIPATIPINAHPDADSLGSGRHRIRHSLRFGWNPPITQRVNDNPSDNSDNYEHNKNH